MRIVDTKGQICPAPLIAAKKALKEVPPGESFTVLTDNQTSFDNLTRFLKDNNAEIKISKTGEVWTMEVTRKSGDVSISSPAEYCTPSIAHFEKGSYVVVISTDRMGDGDEELGSLLMNNFIKAIKDLERLPLKIVFYNKGVTLVTNESPVIDHLKDLEKMGVELLLCATCVNHYGIESEIGAGVLSNMYTIAEVMTTAGSVVKP